MCEKEYQSIRCWEFPDDKTTPSQSFIYPHSQINGCPIKNKVTPCKKMIAITYLYLLISQSFNRAFFARLARGVNTKCQTDKR